MKDDSKNHIHVCFIIDRSGSMYGSINDVKGGFANIIDEQKNIEEGQCSISLWYFNGEVTNIYKGIDVREISSTLNYDVGGSTALYDGVGEAIIETKKWIDSLSEDKRPSKNLIVIMTDGEENSSIEHSSSKVKDMISKQKEEGWEFVYLGIDIENAKDAVAMGITNVGNSNRSNYGNYYNIVNASTKMYRNTGDFSAAMSAMNTSINDMTTKYSSNKV
ncbi:MAG: VWA domain-containing protein [Clostridia bacterium]|nr:VWA domain-containing protein [Clostridia bacterium]